MANGCGDLQASTYMVMKNELLLILLIIYILYSAFANWKLLSTREQTHKANISIFRFENEKLLLFGFVGWFPCAVKHSM